MHLPIINNDFLKRIILFIYLISSTNVFSQESLFAFYQKKVAEISALTLTQESVEEFQQSLISFHSDINHYVGQVESSVHESQKIELKKINILLAHLKKLIKTSGTNPMSDDEFQKLTKTWESFLQFHQKNGQELTFWDQIYSFFTSENVSFFLNIIGVVGAAVIVLFLKSWILDAGKDSEIKQISLDNDQVHFSGHKWDRIIVDSSNYNDLIKNPQVEKIIHATAKIVHSKGRATTFYLGPYSVNGKIQHLFVTNEHVLSSQKECYSAYIFFFHGPMPSFKCDKILLHKRKVPGSTEWHTDTFLKSIYQFHIDYVFFLATPDLPKYKSKLDQQKLNQYKNVALKFNFHWKENTTDLFTTAGFGFYHDNYPQTKNENHDMDLNYNDPHCRLIAHDNCSQYFSGCDSSKGNSGSPVMVNGKVIGILAGSYNNLDATYLSKKCMDMSSKIYHYFPELGNLTSTHFWGNSVLTPVKNIHYNMIEYLKDEDNRRSELGQIFSQILSSTDSRGE